MCEREKLGEILFIEIIKERKRKSNTYTIWERERKRERGKRDEERERGKRDKERKSEKE